MSSIYCCVEKRCSEYHVERPGMDPKNYRAATGNFLRCKKCGSVLRWLRRVEEGALAGEEV